MTPRRLASGRLGTLLAAAAIVAGALTGCAPSSTDLSHAVAETMQQSVVSVAESAAAGDSPAALATLDQLQAQLDGALANGDVSPARAAAIQSAIDLVRADLQPPPAPEPEPTPVDTGGTTVDTGGTDTGGLPDTGNENSGPGNNNGNGNGDNGNDKPGKGKGKG
ncbi:hypothetical protein ACLQ2Q_18565 [Microbacterium sp. DT81.1]|uniref:hypothetical protein n=1 Tax=Microbacterium sp. DT81.1 TaxID=3393413 RepID=UPI003CF8F634